VGLIAFVIKLGLFPYAFPSMMPTWRWLLGAALAGGGVLSAFWTLDGGLADVLGILIGVIITISFVTGVVVRALTLAMSAGGIGPGYSVAVTTAGFGIMVAILVLPILL
jgi:hypothetical protein